ncbi:MAG: helix-turn-helix domain-containing protein [Ruminococcaceae bacterium]|nr:helix-turn-helix domain-containing protein [Oscillospiraceae bacterium]
MSQYFRDNKMKFAISNSKFEFGCIWILASGGNDVVQLRKEENVKIYIVEEGTCNIEIEGKHYLIKKGNFVVIPREVPNRIYNLSDDFKRITLEIDIKKHSIAIENEINEICKKQMIYSVSKNMRAAIDYIVEYSKKSFDGYLVAIESMIVALFFEIFEVMNVKLDKMDIYLSQRIEGNKKMRQIEEYIYKNISSRITAESMANYFNLSTRQIDRITLNCVGETLKDYINRLKRGKARELLIVTDDNLSQIASAIGFSSEHSFIRFFKRMEGITPSQFRKMNKK